MTNVHQQPTSNESFEPGGFPSIGESSRLNSNANYNINHNDDSSSELDSIIEDYEDKPAAL